MCNEPRFRRSKLTPLSVSTHSRFPSISNSNKHKDNWQAPECLETQMKPVMGEGMAMLEISEDGKLQCSWKITFNNSDGTFCH